MVAHHVIVARGDHHLRDGPVVAIHSRHVRLAQRRPVHKDFAMVDAKRISRQRDYALDVALLRVARVVEDHYVAALNGREMIDKLVDEEAIADLPAAAACWCLPRGPAGRER